MLANAPAGAPQILPTELMRAPPEGDVVCLYVHPTALLTVARQLSPVPIVGCNQLTTRGGHMYYEKPKSSRQRAIVFLSPQCLYKPEQYDKMLAHVGAGMRIIFLVPLNAQLPAALQAMVTREFTCSKADVSHVSLAPQRLRVRGRVVPERAVELTAFRSFADAQGDPPLPDFDAVVSEFLTVNGIGRFFGGQMVKTSMSLHDAGVPKDTLGVIECFSSYGWPVVRFATNCVVVVHLVKARRSTKKAPPLMPLLPTTSRVAVRALQELPRLPPTWTLHLAPGCPSVDIVHLL